MKKILTIITLFSLFTLLESKEESIKNKNSKQVQKKTTQDNFKGVKLNFENTSLQIFLKYIEELFDVKFIMPENKDSSNAPRPGATNPQPSNNLENFKINYKSNKDMTKNQIWSLVDLFLENSGFARVAQKNVGKNIFSIVSIPQSNKSAITAYIGTNLDELPDSGRIRYVYFAQNLPIEQLRDLVSKIKSNNALFETFNNLRAIIVTDNAYNIKSLISLIQEIDKSSTPEIMSILKLQNAEASDVAKLYETLRGKDDPFKRGLESKKIGSFYFPQDAKVIPEPRTNSLILLGSKDAIYRIEDFITNHLDTKLKKLPSPIHVYELNYAPAEQVAEILNTVSKFGEGWSEAAEYGGVRGGQKYFSKMTVNADKQGNRLLIRGSEEDYKLIKPTIEQLDQRQPQVVIEVLIVNITLNKDKAIYSAIRNKNESKVNFQTSGFYGQGIQVNETNNTAPTGSLITNLISLVTSNAVTAGSTVLSLGKQSVWALLSSLEQITELNIVSNPFLVATNKYKSLVSLGSTRRVVSGTVFGGTDNTQNELTSLAANLSVEITPQINNFGIINLDVEVIIEEFTDADISNGNKSVKTVKTNTNVADGEVLALGGLIKNKNSKSQSEVPLLGRIPIIGYLFKNKQNTSTNDNLLIFMTPKIITPQQGKIGEYTNKKANYARDILCEADAQAEPKDPIYQWWFKEKYDTPREQINNIVPPQKNIKQVAPENANAKNETHFSLINSTNKEGASNA